MLNPKEELHQNTKGCFKHLLDNKIFPVISTIAIAEYCVKGELSDLPLQNLQILPFNVEHSKRAGQFTRIVLKSRDQLPAKMERIIIPNDSKLMAQAHAEKQIKYYITADTRSRAIYNIISGEVKPHFQFIDLHQPYKESFGLLNLSDN